jgi:hypothetical protein
MASAIHPVYRYWFTIGDPFLAVTGIVSNLFFPSSILLALTPNVLVSQPRLETTMLMQSTAGVYACLLIIHQFVLQPRPGDVALWKSVQAGQTICEGAKLATVLWGILGLGQGLSTEVCVNVGIATCVILFRVAFLLGAGERKVKTG